MRIVPFQLDGSPTVSGRTYFLSPDCFVCRAQGYWVILSLNHDKYLCVAHDDLAPVADRLYGWQDRCREADCTQRDEVDAMIASLLYQAVLTENPKEGKPFAESVFPPRERAIETSLQTASTRPSLPCIVKFFLACGKTDWRLRTKELSRTLGDIERHRHRNERSTVMWNAQYAAALIAKFKTLRPLYPRPYLCLFESLSLLEFLASYRLVPQIYFGVVADPFHAHCWLQYGTTVLDDDLERLNRYKPILSM